MKITKLIITLTLSIMMFLSFNTSAKAPDSYKVSTDDEISITVFNEPDLSINKTRIGANGSISLPLIGQINIKGLSITQIEMKITNLLLDGYLKKPNVSVTITEYRPFYINGEVKKPGSYPYRKGLTIEKAITLAGGFTERASKSSISLVGEVEKRFVKAVSLKDTVKPGDVITISESFF
ncbi:polysaccharide biosynthesis/export family protein [Pseudocolwellia sp. HL-MZ7]|uniref:polysaccharide biosynthesis/export family protein n=1 Tax=Pseudocolwellia sp. HL-MZ7 TaxID=3400627 RepID=UPI003CF6179E